MGFIIILILVTLAIAGTAAFFSIYGLAAIFSGIFWPVVIMGASLEAGKLVAASYVYRYRKQISKMLKIYLISAIVVLMLITSAGIFGFLSMGYQQDSLLLKQQEQNITLLESEKRELIKFKDERLTRRKQIDADITALPNNYITGRQRLMNAYGPELEQLRTDIELYTRQINEKTLKISELKQEKLINEVHTGPIIFIATALSKTTDDATKWMIILIMFAFDPLAVALTICLNNVIIERKNTSSKVEKLEHKSTDMNNSLNNLQIIGVEEIKKALNELQNKELTPAQIAQKGILEEMLQRKLVTEKIRNPKKKVDI